MKPRLYIPGLDREEKFLELLLAQFVEMAVDHLLEKVKMFRRQVITVIGFLEDKASLIAYGLRQKYSLLSL